MMKVRLKVINTIYPKYGRMSNKTLIYILLSIAIYSCAESRRKPESSEVAPTLKDKKVVGYKISSRVPIFYAPLVAKGYLHDGYSFEEHLDRNGKPLTVKGYVEERPAMDYRIMYDKDNHMLQEHLIFYLKNNTYDTINNRIEWKGGEGTIFNGSLYGMNSLKIDDIGRLVQLNRNYEEDGAPRNHVEITYDELDRPISIVELSNYGLDTDVVFKKFDYDSDEKIWKKRTVKSFTVYYSTDVLDSEYESMKDNIYLFPIDFDEKAKDFMQVRKVVPLYD